MRTVTSDRALAIGAVIVPATLAAALVPFRDEMVSANVALVLVVAVVGFAATGRRLPSVLAAISAAASFNLFHTQPYLSLRISSRDDLETAVLLLAVGLIVGEIALRGRRARHLAARERDDLRSIQGIGALVAEGEGSDYVLLATASELTHLLTLVDCRYESGPPRGRPLPVVRRDGSTWWGPTPWDTERWGFPADGVSIPVLTNGRLQGRFVLTAPVGLPISTDQLGKAVALVDQAGTSLGTGAAA